MELGARTPEELESLLEDAFIVRDRAALRGLFADGGLLAAAGAGEARGAAAIEEAARALWAAGRGYVAGAGRVLRARDTALAVSPGAITVARRDAGGTWRVAISVLGPATLAKETIP